MKVYITFGQDHAHSVGGRTFDKDCVAVIDAKDERAGRIIAFELFGDKFCFSYAEEDFCFDKQMPHYPRGLINVEGGN